MSRNRNSGDAVLEARLEDLFEGAQGRAAPRFLGFLDERQQRIAEQTAARFRHKNYRLYGGYEGSERKYLGVFPDFLPCDDEMFPVRAITATFRKADAVSHRDVLGSLTALEIRRETIGDLLVEPGKCVMFVGETVAELILLELRMIGGTGVTLAEGIVGGLPESLPPGEIAGVVSSLRLDCICAFLTGKSREKVAAMISAGLVALNRVEADSGAGQVAEGETITIRGYGKFRLDRVEGTTKKGRIRIVCKVYR